MPGYTPHRPQRYKFGFELENDWIGFGAVRRAERDAILTFRDWLGVSGFQFVVKFI